VLLLLLLLQVRMQGFSAQELSTLAVSLARLEYRPPQAWLDSFAAAAAEQMGNFGAQVGCHCSAERMEVSGRSSFASLVWSVAVRGFGANTIAVFVVWTAAVAVTLSHDNKTAGVSQAL
jgi:hypothetical protein